jgi:hypothetical protein
MADPAGYIVPGRIDVPFGPNPAVRSRGARGTVSSGQAGTVTSESSDRVAVAFARQVVRSPNARWCDACVEVLGVTGAGITLMGRGDAGPICVSSPQVAALEDLQFDLGQGPCRDAHQSGRPIRVPHLDATSALRWPAYVELARRSGISAVFAFPLTVNGVSVGVLTVYRAAPGELDETQQEDCTTIARVLAETILSLQADEPTGELAAELETAVAYRAELYQASGIVAVQLSITAIEAVARIRGHAFAEGEPVATVAADIIAHRLHLPDDRPRPGTEV